MNNSRFQKGSGVYTCGKATRATGRGDNEHVKLCAYCYELGGWINAVLNVEVELDDVPVEYRFDVVKEVGK
jgi:hypothetical protein